jgi:flagellar protein FliL
MATEPTTDGNNASAGEGKAKPARKKLLIVLLVLLLVVAGGGAGAFLYLKKMRAAADEDGSPASTQENKRKDAPAPQYMPLENLVVNLTDDGGTRFVQMGVTLQLSDSKTAERVKSFMPSVRNGFLLLLASQSADGLLQAEGKLKVQTAMLDIVRKETGLTDPGPENPIQGVLFSSLIVQ